MADVVSRRVVGYVQQLPVSFVGSMAYHYESELREAAQIEGFTIGKIMQSPMEGLITYHMV